MVGMAADGLWDISTFLDGNYGDGWAHQVSLSGSFVTAALGLVAMLIKRRRDNFAVTPDGITRTQQS
jgi:hypothetical protein